MATNLEGKSINTLLLQGGLEAIACIPDDKIPLHLGKLIAHQASGKYLRIAVVPGEHALPPHEWQIEKGYTLIYAQLNTEHPDYNPNAFYATQIPCTHRDTGETNILLPSDFVEQNHQG